MTIFYFNGRYLILDGGEPRQRALVLHRLFILGAVGSQGFKGLRGPSCRLKIIFASARAMARAARRIREEYPEIENGGVLR